MMNVKYLYGHDNGLRVDFPGICPMGMRKPMKTCHKRWCTKKDLNLGLTKSKSRLLPLHQTVQSQGIYNGIHLLHII